MKGKMMGTRESNSSQDISHETAKSKYQPTANEAREINKDKSFKNEVERAVDTNLQGGNRQKGVRDDNNS
jgi:hypothetical protein